MLNPPGVSIRYYLQNYPNTANMPEGGDESWIEDVGQRGWFVISQDYNLHIRNNELFALKQHNIGCFYLWGASNSKWETFRCFNRAYDRITSAIYATPRPFVYRIQQNGSLTQIPLQ